MSEVKRAQIHLALMEVADGLGMLGATLNQELREDNVGRRGEIANILERAAARIRATTIDPPVAPPSPPGNPPEVVGTAVRAARVV